MEVHVIVAGADVSVTLAVPSERLAPVTHRQYETLTRLGLSTGSDVEAAELIVDALLGYSHQGAPSGDVARLIQQTVGARVLALDVPSGLELETARLHEPHVRATATLTLALPKAALRSDDAADVVGALYLADISVPPAVYKQLGLAYSSPFGRSPFLEIRP